MSVESENNMPARGRRTAATTNISRERSMEPNEGTVIRIAEFDREDIAMYIDELKVWQLFTKVEKKKLSFLV